MESCRAEPDEDLPLRAQDTNLACAVAEIQTDGEIRRVSGNLLHGLTSLCTLLECVKVMQSLRATAQGSALSSHLAQYDTSRRLVRTFTA